MAPAHDHSTDEPGLAAAERVVLDRLGVGVLVVDAEWRIAYANRAAGERLRLELPGLVGADVRTVCPTLAAEHDGGGALATLVDGVPRQFLADACAGHGVMAIPVRVIRGDHGALVFELGGEPHDGAPPPRGDERAEENAALRFLARQMSAVADSRQLLTILCEAAWAQCAASGAAVVQLEAEQGCVSPAVGSLRAIESRRFELAGSLSREAIAVRGPVVTRDVEELALAPALRPLGLGATLLSPLLAHDEVLGVLVVAREAGAPPFEARELQRAQVIADHASLAVWKARLLERAQAADSAKGRFLATMSHELRTPLTALTGYGELLADQVLGPLGEAQLDVLERMRSVTHHLSSMIEEILAFASLEHGAEVLRPTEFLAADLVQSVAAVVEPIARQKGLRLTVVPPREAALRVTGDVDKMRQVLVNLAGNAVKFTERGEVRLGVERSAHEVRFAVHDTGIGIAPADRGRLFRPFTQLDTGLTRRHGGTGLGLYISQRLAIVLGGRIEVESEAGRGSSFTLVVPVEGE